MLRKVLVLGLIPCAFAQHACAAPSENPAMGPREERESVVGRVTSQGIADLPYARGRRFDDLDAYLAYLEQYNGPVDMPWWREISPGMYREEIRMHGSDIEPQTLTRAQLAKKFGFSER